MFSFSRDRGQFRNFRRTRSSSTPRNIDATTTDFVHHDHKNIGGGEEIHLEKGAGDANANATNGTGTGIGIATYVKT